MELSIASKLPNLESLVLSNNYFRELNQLEPLRHFRKLHSVSLLDNLVTKKENYRLFVIYHVPSLRYLDFIKVRQVERDQARSVFQHWKPSDSTTTTTPSSNSPFVTREMTVQRLTPQDMEKLKVCCHSHFICAMAGLTQYLLITVGYSECKDLRRNEIL